jgi:alanine dehydrogenase
LADVLILNQAEVAALLDLDELLVELAGAFRLLSGGQASVPPRTAAAAEAGLLGAMPVALPGVAFGAKLVTVFPNNSEHSLPTHQALIALFDEDTGTLRSLMDGTRITAARTGGAAAVAAGALARRDSTVLAIVGAGVQGRSHLDAFPRVRDFGDIRIASRRLEQATDLATHHPAARAVDSIEEAVAGADVVCCCTDAREPILSAAWLAPGTHVSAVGGTFGPELDQATVQSGRVFVEWRGAVVNPPPAGAYELQGFDPASVTEIGEVLSGSRPGRTSDDELTIYKSTGHAVEDAAAARLVERRARQAGAGTTVVI